MKEAGENIPCFVSHHLDELPPVTFNSFHVSCLLGKIDRLGMDISTMKQAMSAQTDVCEDLCRVVTGLNQWLCLIEKGEEVAKSFPSPEISEEEVTDQVLDNAGQVPGTTTVLNTIVGEGGSGDRGAETASPKWSRLVKHWRQQHSHRDASIQRKLKMNAQKHWLATLGSRLAFISSFIEESECTCIFVLGDLNADISDVGSVFGRHLNQFCVNNKLVLTSKVMLPTNSFTYISEAWHTTSWLDHCISTADAHDCIMETDILYSLATTDHIPLSMMLDLDSLPELSSYEAHEHREVDLARLTQGSILH